MLVLNDCTFLFCHFCTFLYWHLHGYEITEQLSNYGLDMVAQGTIYPLLLKLEKEHMVTSYLKESNSGPPRKYYSITKNGEEYINSFKNVWGNISTTITKILENK